MDTKRVHYHVENKFTYPLAKKKHVPYSVLKSFTGLRV